MTIQSVTIIDNISNSKLQYVTNIEDLPEKASIFEDDGIYKEALHDIDQALDIDSNYSKAWRYKCNVLSYLGRNEESLLAYGRGL